MAKYQLKEVGMECLPEIYCLMQEQNFPDLPKSYEIAKNYFNDVVMLTINDDDSQIKAVFILGDIIEKSAFFDVVCSDDIKGKWATPAILRKLYKYAFEYLGLDFIWAEPKNKKALKACLGAGFRFINEAINTEPVLILTPNYLPKKFRL